MGSRSPVTVPALGIDPFQEHIGIKYRLAVAPDILMLPALLYGVFHGPRRSTILPQRHTDGRTLLDQVFRNGQHGIGRRKGNRICSPKQFFCSLTLAVHGSAHGGNTVKLIAFTVRLRRILPDQRFGLRNEGTRRRTLYVGTQQRGGLVRQAGRQLLFGVRVFGQPCGGNGTLLVAQAGAQVPVLIGIVQYDRHGAVIGREIIGRRVLSRIALHASENIKRRFRIIEP